MKLYGYIFNTKEIWHQVSERIVVWIILQPSSSICYSFLKWEEEKISLWTLVFDRKSQQVAAAWLFRGQILPVEWQLDSPLAYPESSLSTTYAGLDAHWVTMSDQSPCQPRDCWYAVRFILQRLYCWFWSPAALRPPSVTFRDIAECDLKYAGTSR